MFLETTQSFVSFWIKAKAEYLEETEIAFKIFLPFLLDYLCESFFSTKRVIETKYRNTIDIHSQLHIALSSIEPRLDDKD